MGKKRQNDAAIAARQRNAADHDYIRIRFLQFVEAPEGVDGCWIWKGARLAEDGYGVFWLDGSQVLAHRMSYKIFRGHLPARKQVLHSCDLKPCVAPHHLRAGTAAENAQDAIERGQIRRGETNGMALLTEDDVRAMRKEFIPGRRGELTRLAKKYGGTIQNVDSIVRGKTWRHVA